MFFRRLNWNIVGWFRTVSLISYVVIGLGIAMMAYNWYAHGYLIRLGLSFTGGTDVTVKFKAPTDSAHVREALAGLGVSDATVNTIGKSGDDKPGERYTISTQTAFGNDADKLWTALRGVEPIDRSQSQIESVGPSLSHEYLTKALLALFIAISIQFVYIAFRFGWNYIFGTVVVVALVRDAFMMIGIYAIAGRRADDAFLAAVLTVIGYSVMDTIVILDRIRENVRVLAGEAYDKIVNVSILQTMTRSINTLATVVVTLVALLAFGGVSLQNFAFALLVGICSGGYHSIFFSAPLVHVLRERQLAWHAAQRITVQTQLSNATEQKKSERERAEILAARRERRAREKEQRGQGQSRATQPRYRRRRAEDSAPFGSDLELPENGEATDPLDAQNSGMHDEELALGHEEIHLNLGPEEEKPEEPHAGVTPSNKPGVTGSHHNSTER
jgi:preprotein translocase subunit SecF